MMDFLVRHAGGIVVCIGAIISIFVTRRKARNNGFFLYNVHMNDSDNKVTHNAGFFRNESVAKAKVKEYEDAADNNKSNFTFDIKKVPIHMWNGRMDNTVYDIKGWNGEEESVNSSLVEYYFFSPADQLEALVESLNKNTIRENWTYSGYEIDKLYSV